METWRKQFIIASPLLHYSVTVHWLLKEWYVLTAAIAFEAGATNQQWCNTGPNTAQTFRIALIFFRLQIRQPLTVFGLLLSFLGGAINLKSRHSTMSLIQ